MMERRIQVISTFNGIGSFGDDVFGTSYKYAARLEIDLDEDSMLVIDGYGNTEDEAIKYIDERLKEYEPLLKEFEDE